jgi:hypothetical protein
MWREKGQMASQLPVLLYAVFKKHANNKASLQRNCHRIKHKNQLVGTAKEIVMIKKHNEYFM